jgi:hypothetical protein
MERRVGRPWLGALVLGLALASAVERATEPPAGSFPSAYDVAVEWDSIWSHCEVLVAVSRSGSGTVRSACASEGRQLPWRERALAPAEIEALRTMLRASRPFEGPVTGEDWRGLDGTYVELQVFDRNWGNNLVCSGNRSFQRGPREALLRHLGAIDRPTDRSPASSQVRPNNAFKLTRSIGLSRMEALRATMRRPRRPSQRNAMFGGHHCMDRSLGK